MEASEFLRDLLTPAEGGATRAAHQGFGSEQARPSTDPALIARRRQIVHAVAMRRAASGAFALAAVATALTACSLLVDSGGLSDDASNGDAGLDGNAVADVGVSDSGNGGGNDGAGDAPNDALGVDGSTATTPSFDPGSMWPISTATASASPTTPAFTTSAMCTDLIVLANSGISAGSVATATITTTSGLTFTEATKDAGNNADTIYIWRATNACASRTGTVTVSWNLNSGSIFWSNVVVFAFTHSKGIGAVANAHNPGNTSINQVSITPAATGSWLFASLSGNNGNVASGIGTSGEFVQQFSGEGAIQSYGAAQTPSPAKQGAAVTFSLTSPDNIWASAAVEVLSL